MTLFVDRFNYFNSNVIDNHDVIADECSSWVNLYNSFSDLFPEEKDKDMISREILDYRIYDV